VLNGSENSSPLTINLCISRTEEDLPLPNSGFYLSWRCAGDRPLKRLPMMRTQEQRQPPEKKLLTRRASEKERMETLPPESKKYARRLLDKCKRDRKKRKMHRDQFCFAPLMHRSVCVRNEAARASSGSFRLQK